MRLRPQISRSAVCQQDVTTGYDVNTISDNQQRARFYIVPFFLNSRERLHLNR
jgi:hypothetical protein